MLRAMSRTMRFTLRPESVRPYSAALIQGSVFRFFTLVRGGRYHRLQSAIFGKRRDVRGHGARAEGRDHRERGVERREARHARLDGGAADEKSVAVDGLAERRRVDHCRALAGAEQLQDLLTSLGELAHLGYVNAERTDERGGPGGRDEVVPEPMEPLDDRYDLGLVLVRDGHEDLPAPCGREASGHERLPESGRE